MLLRAEDKDIRLYAYTLQFLDAVLCRLCLQFPCCLEVRYVCEMNVDGPLSEFPFHLSDGLQERCALNISDGSTDFGNNEIIMVSLSEQLDVAFYLIRDMRNDLYCFSKIISAALFVDYSLVYSTSGHGVRLCGLNAGKSLIMSKVEVCLHSVDGDIAFAMLIGVQCSRVDVDIRVELLDGNIITSCL